MGVDRESAVRKAEEAVREGKFDLAIDEYLRLVDDQPGDVGAANALGDLYVKVGNRAAAVTQFNQLADTQRDSGFVPKAVAFYKKALKVDPASDHALSQLAQIAVEQELFADATLYLNRLLQSRRERTNEAGVAECLVRIGGFPTATADAKVAAARASAAHFAPDQTVRLWMDAADALERTDRAPEAVDALMQAAVLQPDDVVLRRRVALACATTGQLDRARAFVSPQTAGDHPDLLLMLAEHALAEGRDDEARLTLERVIAVAPDRRTEAEAMLAPLVAASEPPAHQIPADFFTPDVELPPDPGQSLDVEVSLETDVPLDVAAAFGSGSVEVAGDASEPPGTMDWAALLGDAPGGDASDAAAADPDDTAEPVVIDEEEYGVMEIGEDAGSASEEPPAVADDGVEPEVAAPSPELAAELVDSTETEPEPEMVAAPQPEPEPEVVAAPEPEPEPAPVAASEVEAAPKGEAVPEVAPEADAAPAAPAVSVAETATAADLESIAALTAAAQNPALEFQASTQLGRLLLRLGRSSEGIEWLERATRAETSVRERRLEVMYELADALELAGDRARALDVFADLDFDAASFRDVPERMATLRRALGEGGAT